MPLLSLLDGVSAPVRVRRARWILALGELQRDLAGARSWATLEEWLALWPSDAEDDRAPDTAARTAKRQWNRLKTALRQIGLSLFVETPDRGHGTRLHVASPELVALVELDERLALETLERADARREGREPELLDEDPVPAKLAGDYERHPLRWCSRRYGRHPSALRRVLRSNAREIRPRGVVPIERARPARDVARALAAWDGGATVRAVAQLLVCSRRSAQRFLDRERPGERPPRSVIKARPPLQACPLPSPGRELPVELARPDRAWQLALLVHDAGGSVRDVAWVLRCSRTSAQRFLDRAGRARGA